MNKSLRLQLERSMTMQIATVGIDNAPWICTVYYVIDQDNNFYWLSYPDREHSKHLQANDKIAATIAVKTDMPVIGIQIKGRASVVTDSNTVESVMKQYVAKYNTGENFYDRFVEGSNEHLMYVLKPSCIYLFDEDSTKSSDRMRVL